MSYMLAYSQLRYKYIYPILAHLANPVASRLPKTVSMPVDGLNMLICLLVCVHQRLYILYIGGHHNRGLKIKTKFLFPRQKKKKSYIPILLNGRQAKFTF